MVDVAGRRGRVQPSYVGVAINRFIAQTSSPMDRRPDVACTCRFMVLTLVNADRLNCW